MQMFALYRVVRGENRGALDDVFQLADISRKIVCFKVFPRGFGKMQIRLAKAQPVKIQKISD